MAATELLRRALLVCLLTLGVATSLNAEIYKWVDAKGQVHFSDKRHAHEDAKRIDDEPTLADPSGNEFLFHPDADAMLSQGQASPLGKGKLLSAGNSIRGGNRLQDVSLLRFEISALLTELHRNSGKKLLSATLYLHANTEEKVPGQASPGHMGTAADTAFYLKPVHNNFYEKTVTWEQFYNQNNYTPNAIRRLPTATVPGGEDSDHNFEVDLTPLMEQLIAGNLRQFTLEMRLQRTNTARVNVYSREAPVELRPALRVLLSSPPTP